jgi:hypothetical protein
MLKVIYARRGTGKTKEMIKMANADVGNVKGDIVFLDKDNHCMLDLHHDIRYINTQEYRKVSLEYFMGFIGGVMASDYDIEKMYIDGVPGLLSEEDLAIAVQNINKLAGSNNVEVIMSLSGKKDEMPECIKEFVVQ